MNLKNVDTSEKNTAVLEIGIDKNVFDEEVTKMFKKNSVKMQIPGFRKGKAPRSIIEKMYGKGVFYEDALNEIMPAAIDAAVIESKIEPVSRPEVDVKSIDEEGVVITAKFIVKPEVTVSEYKGYEATKTLRIFTDEDIDKEIEKTRKRNARSIQVTDRAVENGDETLIDYEGFIDGVPFEGGKAERQKLKIGSGQFIPGFEEQLVGKSVGEEYDISVTFPEEYHAKDMAGKEAVFKVKLHEINFEELPAVDDEFAKDVSEFDNLLDYKADILKNLEKRNDDYAQTAVEEQLVDSLLANTEIDVPAVMIENETTNQVEDYAYRMQQQGIDMETYLKYTGMSAESMREQFKSNAERQVKTRLALDKIVKLENIEASEDDINEELKKIAEAYKMEIETVRERIDVEIIKKDLAVRKAVDFIKSNATITTVKKTAEEIEKEQKEKQHQHHHADGEECDCGEDHDHE